MNEQPTLPLQFKRAVFAGDLAAVRQLARRYPELPMEEGLNYHLNTAAGQNDIAMMSLLVDFGADIHAAGDESSDAREGCLKAAATYGATDAVRWLLDKGARVNHTVEGAVCCFPLWYAVFGGHLDVVKLLVERGADINATWDGQNALGFAIEYGQKEVVEYLRLQGARTPWELRGEPMPGPSSREEGSAPLLDHIEAHLGRPEPLSLQEIVPGDPPITIHVVPVDGCKVLVTTGMSSRPMTVPAGAEEFQYAELVIYLPEDWPLDNLSLRDPNHFWPIEWLRRIALYPHENRTWLGGKSVVIANGEPPQPLAPNTRLTSLLGVTSASEFGRLYLADGRQVLFYSLYPLYTEERDLEKDKGTEHLLRLFQQHGISPFVDVHRPNVALRASRRPRGTGRG